MHLSNLKTAQLLSVSGRRGEQTTTLRSSHSSIGLVLVALALCLVIGCSDGSSDGTGGTGGDGEGGSGTSSQPAPGSELDGTWETACYQKAKTALTYDDLDLVGTFTEYSDDACSSAIHVSLWKGTGVVSGETAGGDTKLDLSFTAFESTALTAENAELNNMYMYCGFTDWEANVKKDILGQTCYGFSIPKGGQSLDIYRVEGDTLKFGKGAVIGTDLDEADRPTVIDDSRVFTKI